ncbi:MAG: hypothetical protein WC466_04065 [Candidatus Izemoplasmatales bacterium]
MKKSIFGLIIFLLLFSCGIAFAQDRGAFLQYHQDPSAKIDSLMTLISMIATVFGVIVAIVIAFFTLRQFWVDKDIRAYREEIKKQRDLIIKEAGIARDWSAIIKEKKEEIEKILGNPSMGEAKEKMKKLNAEIEKLQQETAYRQGALNSLTAFTAPSGMNILENSNYYGGINNLNSLKQCANCGMGYLKTKSSPTLLGSVDSSECPYCHQLNL